jgi:hypothetical protein
MLAGGAGGELWHADTFDRSILVFFLDGQLDSC